VSPFLVASVLLIFNRDFDLAEESCFSARFDVGSGPRLWNEINHPSLECSFPDDNSPCCSRSRCSRLHWIGISGPPPDKTTRIGKY